MTARSVRFTRALGRLAKAVVCVDEPTELWVRATELVGQATDVDRVLVYRLSSREGIAAGLHEWLHPVTGAGPTRAIYPLAAFARTAEGLLGTGEPVESYDDAPASALVADGAHGLLHDGMSIRALLWLPFARRDGECLMLVLNRTRERRRWDEEERAFAEVAVGILEPAVELLEQRAALRLTASRYRTLYDATPALFFTVGQDQRVVSANRYACEHLGYTLDELVGMALQTLVHPDDLASTSAALERAFAVPERLQRVTFRKLRRDGSSLWVREIIRVGAGPDGAAHALIACEDITDQRRAEEALLAAQKLETLGVLAGGIAHDFNNLLATILGNLELSRLRLGDGEHALASIERAERGTLRAAELVRSLLSYSASTIERREPVRVDELVRDLRELLQVSMAGSVELAVELAAELPPVLADPAQLRQVLMNLVVNAAESIGKAGGRVVVSASAEPGTVRLEVSDSGAGMTAQTMDRIFDPFFTTKVHGRGLGLAAVRGIVRAHGGAISVRSAPGAGSTFAVTLPSAPASAVAAPA
ncbi:MAG: ATP-binding protein, partial [Myxococcota bacterium]